MTQQYLFAVLESLSTNKKIRIETARFHKTAQSNANSDPKVPLIWDIADWNHIDGLTRISSSQLKFEQAGLYAIIAKIEVFSPSSAKLQAKITGEINAVALGPTSYTGLTVATDFNSSIHIALVPILTANSIGEMFAEKSGQTGILEITNGDLNVIRLSKLDI